MVAAPKRRWLRFSLRTLFVMVTMLCCVVAWLFYAVRWIRERHDALAHLHIGSYAGSAGAVCNNVPIDVDQITSAARDAKPPWSIRLLGEAGVGTIAVYGPQHALIAENLRRLFPEASVRSQDAPPQTAAERMLDARMRAEATLRWWQEQSAVPSHPSDPAK
jgi:hypothetical protein